MLELSGDGFAIGTVMALAGIPRAAFMMVGGALTDRFSPRRVMLASNAVRMALVLGLALLVLSNAIALAFVVDALNLSWVFGAAGMTMTALVLLSMLNPAVRSMEAQAAQA